MLGHDTGSSGQQIQRIQQSNPHAADSGRQFTPMEASLILRSASLLARSLKEGDATLWTENDIRDMAKSRDIPDIAVDQAMLTAASSEPAAVDLAERRAGLGLPAGSTLGEIIREENLRSITTRLIGIIREILKKADHDDVEDADFVDEKGFLIKDSKQLFLHVPPYVEYNQKRWKLQSIKNLFDNFDNGTSDPIRLREPVLQSRTSSLAVNNLLDFCEINSIEVVCSMGGNYLLFRPRF